VTAERCRRRRSERVDNNYCLAYLNNRYHDPTTGALLSVDPLVTTTGMPYLYGNGNPITYSDPLAKAPDPRSDDD
jgi:RHS repeat-associated protein